jgi:hypothetical protein
MVFENSPAIYGWVHGSETSQVPPGTKEMFCRPLTGLLHRFNAIPSLERLGYFGADRSAVRREIFVEIQLKIIFSPVGAAYSGGAFS